MRRREIGLGYFAFALIRVQKQMSEAIRVLLADDHARMRAGVRSKLESMKDVQVVAEAGDGSAAIEAAARLRPDVVLMDISMKDLSWLEATRRIREVHPAIRVIILSMHASEEYVQQAVHAGAAGYILKNAATAELELALRAVIDGQRYLSPPCRGTWPRVTCKGARTRSETSC